MGEGERKHVQEIGKGGGEDENETGDGGGADPYSIPGRRYMVGSGSDAKRGR